MLAVVGLLPERDREVLALCAWAGLSYEQAATILGIPVGTVRSRLAKARAHLAARLDEQSGEHSDVAPASASTKPLDRVRRDVGEEGGDDHAGA